MARIPDAVPSTNALLEDRRRRRRGIVIGAVAALVVAAAVGIGVALVRRNAESPAAEPFTALQACLLGEPLGANERASVRVRAIQLAVVSVPLEKRSGGMDMPWPGRCATYAHAVSEKLHDVGQVGGLADAAEALAVAMKDETKAKGDLGKAVDRVWSDAANEKVAARAAAPADVVLPPKPVTALAVDALPATARIVTGVVGVAKNVHVEPIGSDTLRFLVEETEPLLCTLPRGEATLRCAKVPEPAATLSPGLRFFGTTDDGAPVRLFVGDHGKAGIFRADTGAREDVDVAAANGAYGFASYEGGGFAALGWKDEKPEVRMLRVQGDGKRVETKLFARDDISNPYYVTSILWDWLFTEQPVKDEGVHAYARRIPPNGAEPAAPVDLGAVSYGSFDDEDGFFSGCRAQGALALTIRGYGKKIAFFTGERWTPPVDGAQASGAMTCHGAEAAVTSAGGTRSGSVAQTRCSASECKATSVLFDELLAHDDDTIPSDYDDAAAADVGGKVLVAWRTERFGVRTRFAPIDQLAKAADDVFFDDHMDDGVLKVESSLLEMRLLASNDAALLLLATTEGLYAFRADASGKLAPVTVAMEATK